jgi:TolB protein
MHRVQHRGRRENASGPERHIAIADVASGKVTVLKDTPSDNCFGPVWSPDGSKIAFSIMADKEWSLGVVNADGSGFHFVKNAALKSETFGAPEWARDGKSIFCHDLDKHLPDRSRWKRFEEMGARENLD